MSHENITPLYYIFLFQIICSYLLFVSEFENYTVLKKGMLNLNFMTCLIKKWRYVEFISIAVADLLAPLHPFWQEKRLLR